MSVFGDGPLARKAILLVAQGMSAHDEPATGRQAVQVRYRTEHTRAASSALCDPRAYSQAKSFKVNTSRLAPRSGARGDALGMGAHLLRRAATATGTRTGARPLSVVQDAGWLRNVGGNNNKLFTHSATRLRKPMADAPRFNPLSQRLKISTSRA